MFYELVVRAFCDNQADFADVLDKLDGIKADMRVVNPGQVNQECSVIEVNENHHDEPSPHPCHQLSHWDNCP